MLTIVMYHYVRDADGRFPDMKARTVAEFEGQLDYLVRHYEPVSLADVVAAYAGGPALPTHALLLTFDDGLCDHRETVLPALVRRGLSGCFAPAVDAVLARRVLDVHKVQFVLAVQPDRGPLVQRLFAEVERLAPDRPDLGPEELRRHAVADRFDDADTILVKRLLQHVLPDDLRSRVVDRLFAELVSDDEWAFGDELYLSLDDLRELRAHGMAVTGHGATHRHLGLLGETAQRGEIEETIRLMALVEGDVPGRWAMCYPSGSYDATTLALLRGAGCALGMTVVAALAGVHEDPLLLPRLDTNDLPLHGDAEPTGWTIAAG